MSAEKKKQLGVLGSVIALVVVLVGSILFVGAVSGWFDDPKAVLDAEYYGEGAEFMELSAGDYEELVDAGKSFVVFVDQGGCDTADRLRGFMKKYMEEKGILAYRIMFEDMKGSSLHTEVKYYPSVAIISKGKVRGFLRADAEEDADAYNDYDDLKQWIERHLVVEK